MLKSALVKQYFGSVPLASAQASANRSQKIDAGDESLPYRQASIRLSRFMVAACTTLALCFSDLAIFPVKPWGDDLVPGKLIAKGRAQRTADYFFGKENPEIIFLGSSLIFRASFECDTTYEKIALPNDQQELWDFKRRHVECQYFERLLKRQFGLPVTACEFGIPAAMVSDHNLFVQRLVLFHKSPKLVICTLAPRDFYDNAYKDERETTGWQQLVTCLPVSQWLRHPQAAYQYAIRSWKIAGQLDKLADAASIRIFTYRYYLEQTCRGLILSMLNQRTAPSTVNPAESSSIGVKANKSSEQLDAGARNAIKVSISKGKGNNAGNDLAHGAIGGGNDGASACTTGGLGGVTHSYNDLPCYQFSYNPPDYQQFEHHMERLHELAQLCMRQGYLLVLVDMPVTPENQVQMVPESLSLYHRAMKATASQFDIELISPSSDTRFDASDFVDSVHLTAAGGAKFFDCLIQHLAKNRRLVEKLTN